MIKTIVFDLGNVIALFDTNKASRNLAKYTSVPAERINEIFASELMDKFERGAFSGKEFFEKVKQQYALTCTYVVFEVAWSDMFTINQPVIDLMRNLTKNYRLVMLSNTNEIHYDFVMRTFPLDMLEYHVLSFRVGHRKPEREIYFEAMRHSRCKPAEMTYTDDIPEFAKAATKIGMHGILFQSVEQLTDDLRRLGVRGI